MSPQRMTAILSFVSQIKMQGKVKRLTDGVVFLKLKMFGLDFKPATDYSQLSETERLQQIALNKAKKEKRQKEQESERTERQLSAMGADDRHKCYSEILDQLKVDELTRNDLKKRGFTDEQITQCGFKSVVRNQPLNKNYPSNLPGISDDASHLSCGDGYLMPVRDPQGRIISMQYRLHNPGSGGRYRWLKSSHSKEYGEMPLAVYFPSELRNTDIYFCEGTGVKPFLTSERLGSVVVGAAGGLHTSSPKTLKKYINEIKEILSCNSKNQSQSQKLEKNFSATGEAATDLQVQKTQELSVSSKSQIPQSLAESLEEQSIESGTATQNSTATDGNLTKKDLSKSESQKLAIKFVIIPDAGFALNSSVLNLLEKLADWLKKDFHKSPFFLDWSQINKSQKDIDELESISFTRLLKYDSWLKKYQAIFQTDFYGKLTRRFWQWAKD